MRVHRATVIAIAVCLAVQAWTALEAQPWEGPAAVGLRVTDEDGQPIADAQVVARISDAADLGPPASTTDASGRVVLSGLREGEWFIEVSHQEYMLYAAYVDLRAGKKPTIGFSSQVNTATSWKPMTVKFQKANADFSRGAVSKRAEPKPPEVIRESPPRGQSEPPRVVRPEPAPPKVIRPAATPAEEPADIAPPSEAPQPEADQDEMAAAAGPEPTTPEAPVSRADDEAPTPATADDIVAVPSPGEAPAPLPPVVTPGQPREPSIETAPAAPAPPAAPPAAETADQVAEPIEEVAAATAATSPESEETAAPVPVPATPEEPLAAATPSADPAPEPPVAATPTVEMPAADSTVTDAPVTDLPGTEAPVTEVPAIETLATETPATEAALLTEEALSEAPVVATLEVEAPEAEEAVAVQPVAEPVPAPTPTVAAGETAAIAVTERAAVPPAPTPPAAEEAGAITSAAPTRLPRFLRSAAAGTCSECQPDEWAVAAEQEAARAGDVAAERECSASYLESVVSAAQGLADTPGSRLDNYTGPILTAMFRLDEGESKAALQDLLGMVTDPQSNCQMAGIVLPPDASFSGYVLEAWDSLGGRACRAKFDCAVGQARWLDEPQVVEGAERTVVYTIFKNRSTRRERRLRMTIYFRPGSEDWRPRTR